MKTQIKKSVLIAAITGLVPQQGSIQTRSTALLQIRRVVTQIQDMDKLHIDLDSIGTGTDKYKNFSEKKNN
ncbi:MAG: hypothetical protein FJ333_06780 [Sphingomonadales bacterium]|nr:hypothetical protein [Sphingomonadales bacterium]